MKTQLTCDLCGEVFRYPEPVSLAGIIRDCEKSTTPHIRAKWLTDHVGMPPQTLLCERCFWGMRMGRIKVWWYHLKLQWNGEKKFEENGFAIIPCARCRNPFKSWIHFSSSMGYCYDSECKDCKKRRTENGKRTDGD